MRVNNNIFAQNAYRNVFNTSSKLGKSLEKLSSGLRINRASDDAAGLGVSEKLRAQVSGLDVAVQNSQDGISLIQTAENALGGVHKLLQRVRQLTVSSANGDKTDDDRRKYQVEVDQLLNEINKISLPTEYNSQRLLNGTMGAHIVSDSSKLDTNLTGLGSDDFISNVSVLSGVGIRGVYTIEIETAIINDPDKVANAQFAAARASDSAASGPIAGTNWEGTDTLFDAYGMNAVGGEFETITIRQPSTDHETSVTLDAGDTINEAIKKLQDAVDAEDMKIDVFWNADSDMNSTIDEGTFQFESRVRGTESNFFLSGQNSTGVGNEKIINNDSANGQLADDANNDGIYEGGVGAGLEALATSDMVVRIADPNGTITTVTSHSSTFKADMALQDAFKVIDNEGYNQGIQGIEFQLNVDDVDTGWAARSLRAGIDVSGIMTFQVGQNAGDDHRVSISINNMTTWGLGVDGIDVSSQANSQSVMDNNVVDNAISKVSVQRGSLGAVQNRIEHNIKNLSVARENLASAESRIRDVDVAKEMINFTKNQILQESGTAMLGQANAVGQQVLQLLG